jgi:chromosomal replication initiator protein
MLQEPKIADAVAAVAHEFKLPTSALTGERGRSDVSFARHVVMWLARNYVPRASFERIGRALGNRDHTTILFGVRKIEAMRQADPLLAQALDRFAAEVRARAASRVPPDLAAWQGLGGELRAA